MTGQKELAALIKKGLANKDVMESEGCFLEDISGKFYVCALGAALVGKFGSARTAYNAVEKEREVSVELSGKELALAPDYADIASRLLEVDFDLAEAVDKTHMLGVPALAIINRLEQQNFPY